MTNSGTADGLRTCPDCGGILEPTRPAWAATIEFTALRAALPPAAGRWRCLLCGYHENADDEPGTAAPSAAP